GGERDVVAEQADLRILGAVDLDRLVVVEHGDVGASRAGLCECNAQAREGRGDREALHPCLLSGRSPDTSTAGGAGGDARRTTAAATTGASASARASARRARPSGAIRSHSAAWTANPPGRSAAARAPRSAHAMPVAAHRARASAASGAGTASAT